MEPEYGAQAPEEREHTLPPAVLARARDINSRIAETVYGPGDTACASAWEVSKILATLLARVEALEAGRVSESQPQRGLRTVTVVPQRLTREEFEAVCGPVEPAPEPAAAARCGSARRPTVADLSPDAQAVWDAYEGSGVLRGPALAAALRAAADQVVPGSRYQPIFMGIIAEERWQERQSIRRRMLVLAAELNDANGTQENLDA